MQFLRLRNSWKKRIKNGAKKKKNSSKRTRKAEKNWINKMIMKAIPTQPENMTKQKKEKEIIG